MAVASDLPDLENRQEFRKAQNSLLDRRPRHVPRDARRPGPDHHPVRADRAVDAARDHLRSRTSASTRTTASTCAASRARCGRTSARGEAVQGGSTITQQFVKNATQAQNRRTLLEKVREAALAYHLTRKWSKRKILTEYLNSIYFGNGAYGIESAARTYFGQADEHFGCGKPERRCAKELAPHEAALLAGMVASPTAFDPIADRAAATRRRNIVLAKMLEQGYLTRAEYEERPRAAGPVARHDQPAAGAGRDAVGRLLHDLGAPAGHRPLRRAPGARGRPARADDARPRPAAPGRARRRALARQPAERPAGGARRDRQRDRRDPRDGRRQRLLRRSRSTSPRRASASRARRSSRSCWRRRCGAASRRARRGARRSSSSTSRAASRSSRSTTTTTTTPASARSPARRRSPTTRSTRRSASRPARSGSRARPSGWASAPRSRATTRSRSAA